MKNFIDLNAANHDCIYVAKLIKKSEHFLPEQAPLQFFVHHNTLNHFENLPFKEALKIASLKFSTEPFLSEEAFQKALDSGRIKARDIEEIIFDECPNANKAIFEGGPTHFAFRSWRLSNLFLLPNSETLDWHIYENNLLSKSEAQLLWKALEVKRTIPDPSPKKIRIRDKILFKYNFDTDELTHPLLINLAGSYLDQGLAFKQMPDRSKGFLSIFRNLYIDIKFPSEPWLKNLSNEYQNLKLANLTAEEIVVKILHAFGIKKENWEEFIFQTLFSIKGWAGMFAHFEHHFDHIPVHVLPAKLADFLAVQLILDFTAAKFYLKKSGSDFEKINQIECQFFDPKKQAQLLQYESFLAAQALGLSAHHFNEEAAKKWHDEIATFDNFERRYYLHLAYEKKHRDSVIDGIISHQNFKPKKTGPTSFQVIACFDEREESFRRQLEEICPTVETFGFAGFFGVAMQYLGLDDIRPRALCPVVITPEVLVEEIAIDGNFPTYDKAKKLRGKIINFSRRARKTILLGSIWSFTIGLLKVIPLIGHSVFPSFVERFLNKIYQFRIRRPQTRLVIESSNKDVRRHGYRVGFTIKEMTDIICSGLRTIDLKNNFCNIVMVIGHHSVSLNNPHESAYNCGATGGGNGGINARAFAAMANHPEVRSELKLLGINITESTWFIGASHDTCNDSIEYYDLDLLPQELQTDFRFIRLTLSKACSSNAQERCRRFESVPQKVSPSEAQKYVKRRSMDLAQPRPEYGHGTNAVCLIGRRQQSRGLFLDRRAFLISYNPQEDENGEILGNILQAAGPVGAGINLEYYFSTVDSPNYGCGTKLPHNITGLIAVMDGFSSDLRTGLPWQTVEIHEPVRMLTIVEATPETLAKIAQERPIVGRLVENNWIQLIAWNPQDNSFSRFHRGKFISHHVHTAEFSSVETSHQYYEGKRDHLDLAHIKKCSQI